MSDVLRDDPRRRFPDTPGDRLYQIRLACGDGFRKAEIMTDFVRRVKRITKAVYHPNTISMLERNKQQWRLMDVRTFAAVDPLARGEIWLSALSGADGVDSDALPRAVDTLTKTPSHPLSPSQIEDYVRQAQRDADRQADRQQAQASSTRPRKKRRRS